MVSYHPPNRDLAKPLSACCVEKEKTLIHPRSVSKLYCLSPHFTLSDIARLPPRAAPPPSSTTVVKRRRCLQPAVIHDPSPSWQASSPLLPSSVAASLSSPRPRRGLMRTPSTLSHSRPGLAAATTVAVSTVVKTPMAAVEASCLLIKNLTRMSTIKHLGFQNVFQ